MKITYSVYAGDTQLKTEITKVKEKKYKKKKETNEIRICIHDNYLNLMVKLNL